jgi:hypothetical protein
MFGVESLSGSFAGAASLVTDVATTHDPSWIRVWEGLPPPSFPDGIPGPTFSFVVKNCNDSGNDSLRAAVAASNMIGGDNSIEFDVATMQCSRISLSTGEIMITTSNLTIKGPDDGVVTIDGGYAQGHVNRIFTHVGSGTLRIDHLELTDALNAGAPNQPSYGGCVFSNGFAYLTGVNVNSCRVGAYGTGLAEGGGVWARGMKLISSTVSNCGTISQASSAGGGIFVDNAGFTAKDSTISGNFANSYAPVPISFGGGAAFLSPATLERTIVAANSAVFGGGIFSTAPAGFANSTVTANSAVRSIGAIYITDNLHLYNSTIALNSANETGLAAGVYAHSIVAVSSILAKNVNHGGGQDVEDDVVSSDGQVTGFSNLIIAADASTTLPADTLDGCPRLAPLFDNGGMTRTLALLPGSPAIDNGADPFSMGTDQRGAGFPRAVGAKPDIGAYEWSAGSGEFINRSGFESCE